MVDALATCGSRSLAASRRYYALKAGWFKKKNCRIGIATRRCLRGGPRHDLPGPRRSRGCLTAYRGFSAEMASMAERFFTDRWIDAPVSAGKGAGDFIASDHAIGPIPMC